LDRFGKKYFTIGIIGGQSSGKSTLLNQLFGTDFTVLQSKERRGQTTKGKISFFGQNPNVQHFFQ
jgi:GTPase Era involved in 16S rRNA processing